MTLEILQKDMVKAMKEKNKLRKDVLSSIIGTVKKTAIDEKCKDNVSEELVNKVILKEKKIVQDMIASCPENRGDLMNEYEHKMAIILEYVPKMMTEDETRAAIYSIIATVDTFNTGKGSLMKVVMPRLKGKADGKLINKIVTEIIKETGE